MEIREIMEKIIQGMETDGGIKSVVWVAAGGSRDGHWPAKMKEEEHLDQLCLRGDCPASGYQRGYSGY